MSLPTGTEAACTGTAAAVSPQVLSRVVRLQDDLRVLIEHVLGQRNRSAALTGGPVALEPRLASTDQLAGAPAIPDFQAELLLLAPEAIARDGALLERLYVAIDALARLAAPADTDSIRLTHAFVRGEGDEDASPNVRAQARRLRRWVGASAAFGLVVFFAAIALLVHVDRGRRAGQQLEQVRADYQAVLHEMMVARTALSQGAPGAANDAGCRERPAEDTATPDLQDRSRQQQHVQCLRLRDVLLRMDIVYRELRVWNTITDRLSYASPVTWLSPTLVPVPGLSEEQWQSTELRTSTMMTALTGFVLPMLLGLLGACVYVYREIDGQVEASTLEAREGVHGTLRMLLGAILGGLLGAIWTNGQPIQLEGASLSLGAVAFFVGFGVEVVFRLVDTLVRAVADRISKPSA